MATVLIIPPCSMYAGEQSHMRTMVLVYLPTKLGGFVWAHVGVHIPAPWIYGNLNSTIISITIPLSIGVQRLISLVLASMEVTEL